MLKKRQIKQAMGELWQNSRRQLNGGGLSGLEKYRAAKDYALRHDEYIAHRWRTRRLMRTTTRLVNEADESGKCCKKTLIFKAKIDGVEREFKAFYDNACCGPSWTVIQWEPFKVMGVWHIEPDEPITDLRIVEGE